jgi:hypothetical protein
MLRTEIDETKARDEALERNGARRSDLVPLA